MFRRSDYCVDEWKDLFPDNAAENAAEPVGQGPTQPEVVAQEDSLMNAEKDPFQDATKNAAAQAQHEEG